MLGRRRAAIPSGDLRALRREARFTRILRTGLAAAAFGALLAAVGAAAALRAREASLLPEGSVGIVVMDVSQSVDTLAYSKLSRALARVAAAEQTVGLVIFSDIAYEALPPGASSRELRPLLRYFAPRPGRSPIDPRAYPRNPWVSAFAGGTQISDGIRIAREVLERDKIENGAILLLSDLETASSDQDDLSEELVELRRREIPIRVVPLIENGASRPIFERLLGTEVFVQPSTLEPGRRANVERTLAGFGPELLLAHSAILIVLLAVNERLCATLELRRPREVPA